MHVNVFNVRQRLLREDFYLYALSGKNWWQIIVWEGRRWCSTPLANN